MLSHGKGNGRVLSAPSPLGRPGAQSSSLASLDSPHRSVYKSPAKPSHGLSISTPSRRVSSAFSPTPTPNSSHHPNHHHSRHSHSATATGAATATATGNDLMKFTHTIDDMDKQLSELKYLFRPMNPLVERDLSALKIQSVVRRWISQRKYKKYWDSISSWRIGRSEIYLPIISHGIYRCSRITSAIQSMQIKKSSKLLKSIFDRWVHICKQSAPFRRSMVVAAEERYRAKIFKFKLEVCPSHPVPLDPPPPPRCSFSSSWPSRTVRWGQTHISNFVRSGGYSSNKSVKIFK
jgi:hypothetical protein